MADKRKESNDKETLSAAEQSCMFYLRKKAAELREEGMPPADIGRWVADWGKKAVGYTAKPRTIERAVRRMDAAKNPKPKKIWDGVPTPEKSKVDQPATPATVEEALDNPVVQKMLFFLEKSKQANKCPHCKDGKCPWREELEAWSDYLEEWEDDLRDWEMQRGIEENNDEVSQPAETQVDGDSKLTEAEQAELERKGINWRGKVADVKSKLPL